MCIRDSYGPTEAAYHIGVDCVTLNRWRRDGWLQGFPFGRGYVYTHRQLQDALVARGRDRIDAHVFEEDISRGR